MRATRQARDETAEAFLQAGRRMGEGAVYSKTTIWGFKINPRFVKISQ